MKFLFYFFIFILINHINCNNEFDYDNLIKELLNEDDGYSDIEYPEFLKQYPDYGYNGKLDEILSREFERGRNDAYLDYTGSGVYRKSQLDAVMNDLSKHLYGNTHSINPSSLRTSEAVEEARDLVLRFFNTTQAEYQVIFTSGATGALKLVADSFPWSNNSRYMYLQENHNSVLGIREIAESKGVKWHSIPISFLPTKEQCELNEIEQPYNVPNQNPTYSLFAFPAEENFAGEKFPLEWIEAAHKNTLFDCDFEKGINNEWKVLLDAAAFVPTQRLDLHKYKPDFVALSFYKMFGYPTGIGALLVKNDMTDHMMKRYFGGGTVVYASEESNFCLFHQEPCAKFEDGTVNFLSIAALKYGFKALEEFGIDNISKHVHALTDYLYTELSELKHSNGQPLVEIYGKHSLHDPSVQGGIVTCNLKNPDGSYMGYHKIQINGAKNHIHFRTGCNCNPGACRYYMNVTDDIFKDISRERTSCSDEYDLVNGKPTGASYLTSYEDVKKMINFIKEYIQ